MTGERKTLPQAPSSVVQSKGKPAFGLYQGFIPRVDWSSLGSSLFFRTRTKSWHYVSIFGPKCVLTTAIVDFGWGATAFIYLFDREERKLLVDLSFRGIPGVSGRVSERPGPGAFSRFTSFSGGVLLEQPVGLPVWLLRINGTGGFRVNATLHTDGKVPTPICAIAPAKGGLGNCTHKQPSLPVEGMIEYDGKVYDLNGYTAFIDHTRGILGREAAWRWVCAADPKIGINLVEGFNDSIENVVWVDGTIVPVGPVKIQFDEDNPLAPWTVRSEREGAVDLVFTPEGSRKEDIELVVARSHYLQPIGVFNGRIDPTKLGFPDLKPVEINRLVGVTENHATVW